MANADKLTSKYRLECHGGEVIEIISAGWGKPSALGCGPRDADLGIAEDEWVISIKLVSHSL